MPELMTSNYKRYYNNNIFSCAALFTLIMLLLIIFLPALIVIYCKGKYKLNLILLIKYRLLE